MPDQSVTAATASAPTGLTVEQAAAKIEEKFAPKPPAKPAPAESANPGQAAVAATPAEPEVIDDDDTSTDDGGTEGSDVDDPDAAGGDAPDAVTERKSALHSWTD